MLPDLSRLYELRHDKHLFEVERNRLICEYISSIPEENRKSAYLMQLKIDEARMRLSPEELLQWMQHEASELAENLSDQFLAIAHKAHDIKAVLRG